MGVCKGGISGKITGSVGDKVYSVYNGKQVVKEKAKKSTKELSTAQLVQQAKFATLGVFLGFVNELITIGYPRYCSKDKPALAKAFKYHHEYAVIGEYPNFMIDYPRVRLSHPRKKILSAIIGLDLKAILNRGLQLRWEHSFTWYDDSPDDQLMLLFYNVDKNLYIPLKGAASRMELVFRARLLETTPGDTVHGWAFFAAERGTAVSETVYLGKVVML